jgi:hypothetical protein
MGKTEGGPICWGKDATTEDNMELGKISDVSISSLGKVYYLVEKMPIQTQDNISPKKDALTSNERVVTHAVQELQTI